MIYRLQMDNKKRTNPPLLNDLFLVVNENIYKGLC